MKIEYSVVEKNNFYQSLDRSDRILTNRQAEIFQLLANGLSRPDVARKLYIADGTVRSHIRKAKKRLFPGRKRVLLATAISYAWMMGVII